MEFPWWQYVLLLLIGIGCYAAFVVLAGDLWKPRPVSRDRKPPKKSK